MAEAPSTHPSLLLRLRNPADRIAWGEFVDRYAPIVYGFGRRRGLQDADAADLTQTVLRRVSGAIGRFHYAPEQGTFRGWLFTIVRNEWHRLRDRENRRCRATGDSEVIAVLERQPAPDDAEQEWEHEWRRCLFARAAEVVQHQVQDRTWRAFWRTAVEGEAVEHVAGELELSAASVYLAKSRVLARLRDEVQRLSEGE